jgi:hypothetical protein
MPRRNFTPTQKEAIRDRAKNADGLICCEGCGLVLGAKPHEIDHTIAEGLRPAADKKKLTIADGQLLGMECCHRGEDGKTGKDIALIAQAKRREVMANATKKPATRPIQSRGFPTRKSRAPKAALAPKQLYAKQEQAA